MFVIPAFAGGDELCDEKKLMQEINQNKNLFNNQDPFTALTQQEGQIYRAVKTRKTIKFQKNDKNYFAKIYWGVGWWEIIKNLMRGQKPVLDAKQEESAILRLKEAGVNVPEVIACESRGLNPAQRQSFIVLEAIEPSISLEDYVLDWKNKPLAIKRKLIHQVAEMARKMHAAGVNHRDFYICHFLLSLPHSEVGLTPENLKLTLIDLHRAQYRPKVPYRWLVKDLAALYFSLLSTTLSSRDYLRFVKGYSQKSLRESLQNPLWQAVRNKSTNLYKKIHSIAPPTLQRTQLLGRNTAPTMPAKLYLADNGEVVMLKKILRWLPGRRAVFLAEWRDETVVIKVFLHRLKGNWHKQEEIRGLQKLAHNNFPAPEILYEGKSKQGYSLIITRYIDNAQPLSFWIENDNNILKTVELLAQHHQKGLSQQDLHLNNFLVKDNSTIYTLDAAEIRSSNHPLNQKRSLHQLALFCAQLPQLLIAQAEELLQHYAQQRNWVVTEPLNKNFIKIYHRVQYWRQRKFLPKLFRNCTAYQVQQNYHKRVITRRDILSPEFNLFLSDPDSSFTRSDVKILKNGRSCRVAKLKIADQLIVIKHYRRKNLLHGFTRLWRPSRAARCWYYAHLLEMHGIATPKPLAIIEKRWGWLRRDAYFISAYYPAPSLWDHVTSQKIDEEEWRKLQKSWHQLEQRLVDAQLEHGDNKAQNFLISENELILLDLDSMRQHRCKWLLNKARQRDQQRFLRSWNDYPEIKKKWMVKENML